MSSQRGLIKKKQDNWFSFVIQRKEDWKIVKDDPLYSYTSCVLQSYEINALIRGKICIRSLPDKNLASKLLNAQLTNEN